MTILAHYTMTKAQEISLAYNKAKSIEIKLIKVEKKAVEVYKQRDDLRKELVLAKDDMARLHREVATPIYPTIDPSNAITIN